MSVHFTTVSATPLAVNRELDFGCFDGALLAEVAHSHPNHQTKPCKQCGGPVTIRDGRTFVAHNRRYCDRCVKQRNGDRVSNWLTANPGKCAPHNRLVANNNKRKNDITRSAATRYRKAWTSEEIAACLNPGLSDLQVATVIRRSRKAVSHKRQALRTHFNLDRSIRWESYTHEKKEPVRAHHPETSCHNTTSGEKS